MELKELLGEELYKQVQAKIDEKNSTETDIAQACKIHRSVRGQVRQQGETTNISRCIF